MSDFKSTISGLKPFYGGLPIIAIIMVACIMMAKRYLNYTTPMFESTAKIKLADNHEGVANSNLFKDFDVFTNTNKIAAEVELLKSKVLVEKAIADLDIQTVVFRVGKLRKTELYLQSPIIVKTNFNAEKWFDKTFQFTITNDSLLSITLPDGKVVKGKLNTVMATSVGSIAVIKNEAAFKTRTTRHINDNYECIVYSKENLVNKVISDLDVMAVDKDVPVLRISYKSPDAEKAANITNAVAGAYIADYIEEKFRYADTASNFLSKELNTYSGKLAASENAIEAYRNQKNIINIRQETETDLRKISDLQKQKAALEMKLIAIDSLNKYLKRGKKNFDELAPNYESFTDLLSTEMIKKAKELQRERYDLLTKYTPEHERVKIIDNKINDINNYFLESVENTGKHLHIEYDDLNNTIDEAEKKFIGLPTREKNMTILERQFGLNEQIYRFLHEKRTESEIAKAAKISFHRIISQGETPKKPVSPNATIIKVFAGFLGFLFGTIFIYLVHFLKGRVNTEDNIYKNSSTPVLALIPFIKNRQKATAVFKKWMIELDLKGYLSNGAIITFSSFSEKEGKRFIANKLFHQSKLNGKKILMVDADGSMNANEFENYINLSQIALPWQQTAVLGDIVETWKQQYDAIIIKNSPIAKDAASMLLMAKANLNIVILDSIKTKKSRIAEADLMQQDLQLPNMQFVLNRAGYTPTIFTNIVTLFKNFKKN